VGERFRIGRIVARSFAIWARELPLLLALVLVVHAPCVVAVECLAWAEPKFPEAGAAAPGSSAPADDTREYGEKVSQWLRQADRIQKASLHLQWLFTHLSVAFVTFAVCARLRGQRAGLRENVRGALRRLVPVLHVSLCLVILEAALWWGLVSVLWPLVLRGYDPIDPILPYWFLARLSVVALLSPFWVAVPAAVVEEPRRLLRRSWRLARGHRLAVCGILLLLYALDWGSGRLLGLAVPFTDLPWLARKGIWWTQDLLVVSLTAVCAAVGYHALRLEKEGVDVSDLERVFT
jgi:hypothetical protein